MLGDSDSDDTPSACEATNTSKKSAGFNIKDQYGYLNGQPVDNPKR